MRRGRRSFGRCLCVGRNVLRLRGNGRLQMITVAISVPDRRRVVFGLRAGRSVVVVSQARSHSYRCRGGDYGTEAEEHDRVGEGWYRSRVLAAIPHPAGAHHDVNLEQKCAEAGGLHEFGFAGVGAERCTRGPGHRPKSDRTDIAHDPRGEHARRGPSQQHPRPNQLKQSHCDEKQPRRYPLLPVSGYYGEVDYRGAE
jgi:hypothetical protein